MSLILSGTDGLSDIDGTAATPAIRGTDANTGIFFPAADTIAVSTSGSERVRIDSSGNVGIGTVSPANRLDVVATGDVAKFGNTKKLFVSTDSSGFGLFSAASQTNTGIYASDTSSFIYFATSSTERMRIDSSGNLLVGTTSAIASSRFRVTSSDNTDNTYTIYVDNSSATQLFSVISDGDFNTGTATHSPYNYTTANAANMVVESSGLVKRSTSSLKYKKNIADATHGLTDVLKLRSVIYEGKAEGDAGKTFGGLIAEEVHAVGLTEFVQYAEDGTPDALAYGNMVSLCIKAIQEQQALIQSLTTRITALETQSADNPAQGATP